MNKLKIRNFGPIQGGYSVDDEFLAFPRLTVFCGPQGSGKSSVAKLYSALVWMEKTIYRYWLEAKDRGDKIFFLNALKWQGIDTYLRPTTEIEYIGEYALLAYRDGAFTAEVKSVQSSYRPRQIMYIPAERNLASIIRKANSVQGLPGPLENMQVAFQEAKEALGVGYKLPANGYSFQYDRARDESWIVNGDSGEKTRLEFASSGLQSIVPLLLVSDYLEGKVLSDDKLTERTVVSARDELMCREVLKGAKAELATGKIDDLTYSTVLKHLYEPNHGLVSVIEEPEQNLYPETQCDVVNKLLALANSASSNQIVISTHSPYVVNDIVTAQMAAEILAQSNSPETKRSVDEVYPVESAMSQSDMALYELSEKGIITLLETEGGVFSDTNMLNAVLGRWNDSFDRLLEIEARLNG